MITEQQGEGPGPPGPTMPAGPPAETPAIPRRARKPRPRPPTAPCRRRPALPPPARAAGRERPASLRSLPGMAAHDVALPAPPARASSHDPRGRRRRAGRAPTATARCPATPPPCCAAARAAGRTYRRTYRVRVAGRAARARAGRGAAAARPEPGRAHRGVGVRARPRARPRPRARDGRPDARAVGRTGAHRRARRRRRSASPRCAGTWRPARSSSAPASTATALLFTIESWARSGDRLYDLLYDKVPLDPRDAAAHVGARLRAGGRAVRRAGRTAPSRSAPQRWSEG